VSSAEEQGATVWSRLYRALLFCFPADVRRDSGREMLELFSDLCEAERERRGLIGVVVFSLRAYVEISLKACAEHLEHLRRLRTGQPTPSKGFAVAHRDPRARFAIIVQDLRHALRRLARSPGFAAMAIFSLAIGIGANAAVFSVINAVLIRERPYQSSRELVHVYSRIENRTSYANSAYQDLTDLKALDDVFADVGAFAGRMARATENDEPRRVMVEAVTHNLLPMLGLDAAVGRTFLPEEDVVAGAHYVAILGYGYWVRRYAADYAVLGRSIELAGRPYTIIGVMPERLESLFMPGARTDLFVPMTTASSLGDDVGTGMYTDRVALDVKIIGRLRPGVDLDHARARVDGLTRQLREAFPEAFENRSFNLVPTRDVVIQPDLDAVLLVPIAALLMAMVGLVLLLTCTNLASFLLAQGVERSREMALRLALGAGRGRLVSQLLTETLLFTAAGSAVGLLIARWSLDLMTSLQPPLWIAVDIDHRLDPTVLLFTVGVATAAGLLAGLVPAIRSTKPDLASALKIGCVADTKTGLRMRNGLVACQIGISTVLLVGGGLFLRSLQEAQRAERGFTTRDAGVVWVDLQLSGIPQERWSEVAEALTVQAERIPGIAAVGSSSGIPLAQGIWHGDYVIPGIDPPLGRDAHHLPHYAVDHRFLEVMGIELASGRGITTHDGRGTEPVVLVSESAAGRFWPGESPLGKQIVQSVSGTAYRVVGIVRDVKILGLGEAPQPVLFLAQAQGRGRNLWLVARGQPSPPEIAAGLHRVVRDFDEELVVMLETTLEEQVAVKLFPFRLAVGLLSVFGLMALVLAAIGLYGVVSFSVVRRTREVGIRLSLGAVNNRVMWMLVRGALVVVVVGGLIGLAAAAGAAQLLRYFLIGVRPVDPVTVLSVPLILWGVAAAAAIVPARRASRANPVTALRYE